MRTVTVKFGGSSLADAEQGKDVSKSFDTVEDLMEDLKK